MGVKVTIDTAKVGEQATLWPVLHMDGGLQDIFEWGYNASNLRSPVPRAVRVNLFSTGGQLAQFR
jgi:hypothetical protein